ncbi:SAM-dependent methyltransferase [Luteibaculum oceani]|uniref:SAM-dependent methyltransferase n=1 Tax=Luteibaculum oceani TaxID=1294296 RepID=A0A5C6UU99_9FLAO|nr:SAM-dependent methyltransferase [Luteibaculum oceani]TXC76164.1 SAM-dependent methyltransferase [Luteibaculum oceani]
MEQGTLYLVPCHLGEDARDNTINPEVRIVCNKLDGFLAENPKSCRAFLKSINLEKPLQSFDYYDLNKRTSDIERSEYISLLKSGKNLGIISEAGCPGIADPGADMVRIAQQNNIKVVPLVGPSSILLALIATGIGGQQFTFHGYLPVDEKELKGKLDQCIAAAQQGVTQIVMETPYRNLKLFKALCNNLPNNFQLGVASNLTQKTEWIKTQKVSAWSKQPEPSIHKVPTIFVFGV